VPLIVFGWLYVQYFEVLWFIPAGVYLLFNLWIMVKIWGVFKSLK